MTARLEEMPGSFVVVFFRTQAGELGCRATDAVARTLGSLKEQQSYTSSYQRGAHTPRWGIARVVTNKMQRARADLCFIASDCFPS